MATGDMIVMRKTSMRTIEQGENEPRTVTEQALDQLEGTLLDVTPDSVRFEVDGEKIPVRREKLEGLVYFHPASANSRRRSAGCSMRAARPGCCAKCGLPMAGSRQRRLGGVAIELPLAAVAKIDFSVGNVAFLADLEPDFRRRRTCRQPAAARR